MKAEDEVVESAITIIMHDIKKQLLVGPLSEDRTLPVPWTQNTALPSRPPVWQACKLSIHCVESAAQLPPAIHYLMKTLVGLQRKIRKQSCD